MILIDTSALLGILDSDQEIHEAAAKCWFELLDGGQDLVITSYIQLETCALVQNRLGIEALRGFHLNLAPLLKIEWLTFENHNKVMEALLVASRRQLSLVDCASFETMRRLGIQKVFTFDQHFADQGFQVLPASQ
jgi:predicted nucleic acid-binding protein